LNISGILVVVRREALAQSIARLEALPGIEVHHTHGTSGRIVITQEAASVDEEMEGLMRIKALPDVVMAEMVYHFFGDEAPGIAAGSASAPESSADAPGAEVPSFLND